MHNVVDSLLALIIVPAFSLTVILKFVLRSRRGDLTSKLLVIDTAYTLKLLKDQKMEDFVTCRDLGGFFEAVTTVHPLVGADGKDLEESIGPIRAHRINSRHMILENPISPIPAFKAFRLSSFLLSQWRLIRELDRVVRREGRPVLRIGDPHYQGLLGVFLARRHSLPLVIRIGGNLDAIYEQTGRLAYPKILPAKRIEKAVERFVLRRADLVVGANQDNLEYAIRNGADRDRTSVFRYGNLVAPVHFSSPEGRRGGHEALAVAGLDPQRPILLFVGRLEPVKHARDLIEVHAQVLRRHPNTQLLIVGDGTDRQEMSSRAESYRTNGSVFFVGNRDQEWIAKVVPHVDVVVATHMGRALVETALGGVPVAAYDHDWHSELVEDRVHGYLVPFGDRSALADAAVRVLDDPEGAVEMGRRIRAKAYEMMHPDRLNAHERAVYRELLSRRFYPAASGNVAEAVET